MYWFKLENILIISFPFLLFSFREIRPRHRLSEGQPEGVESQLSVRHQLPSRHRRAPREGEDEGQRCLQGLPSSPEEVEETESRCWRWVISRSYFLVISGFSLNIHITLLFLLYSLSPFISLSFGPDPSLWNYMSAVFLILSKTG